MADGGEEDRQRVERPIGNELVVRPAFNIVPIELPQRRPLVSPLRCRFYNTTDRFIDLIWVRQDGFTHKYNTLKYRQFETIGTYEGHRWKFCDTFDGRELVSYPHGTTEYIAERAQPRIFIYCNPREISLHLFCFRSICSSKSLFEISPRFITQLELPRILEREFIYYLVKCYQYQSKYSHEISSIADRKCIMLANFLRRGIAIPLDHIIELPIDATEDLSHDGGMASPVVEQETESENEGLLYDEVENN